MSSRSKKSSGAGDAPAASPSPTPPRGPFVLPKDRPPRPTADDDKDSDSTAAWCNWMCRLCNVREAPEWSVHNNYIHTGYRDTSTFRGAIRSVRTWTGTDTRRERCAAPQPSPSFLSNSHLSCGLRKE
jgi:hypothetical protein